MGSRCGQECNQNGSSMPDAVMRETIGDRQASACRYKIAIPGAHAAPLAGLIFDRADVYQGQQPNLPISRESACSFSGILVFYLRAVHQRQCC